MPSATQPRLALFKLGGPRPRALNLQRPLRKQPGGVQQVLAEVRGSGTGSGVGSGVGLRYRVQVQDSGANSVRVQV